MGVDVKYAIHPVAGRMPGRANECVAGGSKRALSAVYDMDDINPQFEEADVALVIGCE
jgi:NAD(P) transhydrogenase subunit beta